MENKKIARNLWLDILRGFSAIWIVLYHFNGRIPEQGNLYYQFTRLGYIGVPIFFVISGYCIQLSVRRSKSVSSFYWRRFCRIYIPYFASLLVVIATIILIKLMYGTNDLVIFPQNILHWLATLTITTAPASSISTINWVYWSLTYEIFFYLVMGLSLFNKKLELPIIYAVTGLSFVTEVSHIPGLFFLDRWCLFLLGIGLCELIHDRDKHGKILILLSIVGIFLHSVYPAQSDQIHGDPSYLSIQIATLLTAISIWLSFKWEIWFIKTENWLTWVGNISYSLYLLHVPIGCYLLIRYRQGIWLDLLPLHILYDLSLVILCLGISFIFFQLVEKPAIALGKQKINLFNIKKTSLLK